MTRRRRLGIATVLAGMAMAGATPAGAHGIGGRTDLPLPAWQLAWAAGFAVASSFVALGAFWSQPRLVAAAETSDFETAWKMPLKNQSKAATVAPDGIESKKCAKFSSLNGAKETT